MPGTAARQSLRSYFQVSLAPWKTSTLKRFNGTASKNARKNGQETGPKPVMSSLKPRPNELRGRADAAEASHAVCLAELECSHA